MICPYFTAGGILNEVLAVPLRRESQFLLKVRLSRRDSFELLNMEAEAGRRVSNCTAGCDLFICSYSSVQM
jgi:hypothetical protein